MIAEERLLDFTLPAELEAHEPPEARGLRRDQVRLLVSSDEGDRIVHARFADLPDFLRPADLLVANDSATLPAALTARRTDGSTIALHFSTRLPGRLWVVEPRKTAVAPAELLALPGGGTATLLAPYADSSRLWIARFDLPAPVLEYLQQWGRPIAYPYVRGTLLERLPPERIHVINHHVAHASATFYSSAFPDAAIVIADGRGSDNETQTLFLGEDRRIDRIERTDRIGIGLLYAAVTQAIRDRAGERREGGRGEREQAQEQPGGGGGPTEIDHAIRRRGQQLEHRREHREAVAEHQDETGREQPDRHEIPV